MMIIIEYLWNVHSTSLIAFPFLLSLQGSFFLNHSFFPLLPYSQKYELKNMYALLENMVHAKALMVR